MLDVEGGLPAWIPTVRSASGEPRPCCVARGRDDNTLALPLFPSWEAAMEMRGTGASPSELDEVDAFCLDNVFELAGLAWFVRNSSGSDVDFLMNYQGPGLHDLVPGGAVLEVEAVASEKAPDLDAEQLAEMRADAWLSEGEVGSIENMDRFGLAFGVVRVGRSEMRENLVVRMRGTPRSLLPQEVSLIIRDAYTEDGIEAEGVVGPVGFGAEPGRLHAFHRVLRMGPRE